MTPHGASLLALAKLVGDQHARFVGAKARKRSAETRVAGALRVFAWQLRDVIGLDGDGTLCFGRYRVADGGRSWCDGEMTLVSDDEMGGDVDDVARTLVDVLKSHAGGNKAASTTEILEEAAYVEAAAELLEVARG